MIYLPVIGALLEATGTIFEKRLLMKKFLNYKNYNVLSFFAIAAVMLPFLYFFWKITPEAFLLKNILIFSVVIIASIIANLTLFYAYKWEKISELEPIRLTQPLFTVFLAVIIYSSERNFSLIALAIIASIALVATHIKKHHLVCNKYIISALISSLFFAIELVASKAILDYYSSFTFYFLRCLFIFIVSLLIFMPSLKGINKKTYSYIFGVAIIWIFYRIILYWGYGAYGIVFTTILFILSPVFILAFAKIFLKEKLTLRQIIATSIMVLCVVAAILIEN
ncbi:MAG: DMT family transporter [Nanoarchaeota archaeon]|nr:DMT family transporter [Nanoarchaeota archaeon]